MRDTLTVINSNPTDSFFDFNLRLFLLAIRAMPQITHFTRYCYLRDHAEILLWHSPHNKYSLSEVANP